MSVNSLSVAPYTPTENRKKNHVNLKTTGYASMGLLMASGFTAMNKKTFKSHKYLGWAGILAGMLHLGICLGKKQQRPINKN